jgi:hypothetical protein
MSERRSSQQTDALAGTPLDAHATRVAAMATGMASVLGMQGDALTTVRVGARLHDIGKLCVPDHILYKPGPLTAAEWVVMRQHPQLAMLLLAPLVHGGLYAVMLTIMYHHERWDGRGYPHGLAGDAIPLAARIVAVVDTWDALTSDRPYRGAWSDEAAHAYIAAQAGRRFDPVLAGVFGALYGANRGIESPYVGSHASLALAIGDMQRRGTSGRMLIIRPNGGSAGVTFQAGAITAAHAVMGMIPVGEAMGGGAAVRAIAQWKPVRYGLMRENAGTTIVPADESQEHAIGMCRIRGTTGAALQVQPTTALVGRVMARLKRQGGETT